MLKSQLVKLVSAKRPDLFERDVQRIVDGMLEVVSNAFALGARAELRGFGTFSTKNRAAKLGRNPINGAEVYVPAKRILVFRAGKEVRALLNRSAAEIVDID